jgi:hypothetical protein
LVLLLLVISPPSNQILQVLNPEVQQLELRGMMWKKGHFRTNWCVCVCVFLSLSLSLSMCVHVCMCACVHVRICYAVQRCVVLSSKHKQHNISTVSTAKPTAQRPDLAGRYCADRTAELGWVVAVLTWQMFWCLTDCSSPISAMNCFSSDAHGHGHVW